MRSAVLPDLIVTRPGSGPNNKLADPLPPMVSLTVTQQPPSEIRTSEEVPTITASLNGLIIGDEESWGGDSMWGLAALVSADERSAMAEVAPDILTGRTVSPVLHRRERPDVLEHWVLIFDDLVIHQPGYFKIRITLMEMLQREDSTSDDPTFEPPREVLNTATNLIYVHAFAPQASSGVSFPSSVQTPCPLSLSFAK